MENQSGKQGTVDNRYAVSPATISAVPGRTVAALGERSAQSPPYAGFWRRTGAYLIDYVLVVFAAGTIGALLAGVSRGLTPIVVLVSVWLYYALMESSELQATLGKRAVGIKVTDLEGNRVSFTRATGRLVAHLVSSLTLGIGFAMAVFTSRRQTLHDNIAGTLVVGREWTEEEVAAAGAAPPVPVWASVLAVLAVVLFGPFGIGMLAAIAIPAYQSYTIRAQIADGLRQAEPYKAEVAAAVAKGRPLADVDFPGLDLGGPKSKYVVSVRVVSGAVAIDYGLSANRIIAGKELVLVPGLNERQKLVWACGHASPPQGVTMAFDNYAKMTGIPDIYLPIACRGNR
jgi:uncharacterized RDD family membrane protein YckC/Tfp pilus assembly major pilin PilA